VEAPAATNARAVIDQKTLPIGATTAARKSSRVTKPALTVTLPKPIASSIEAKGRFGKQDFVYLSDEDVHRCPAGEKLAYHYTNEKNGLVLRRYWTNACQSCAIKQRCTTGKERQITRWEHEHVLEAVQKRLDRNPLAMRQRRETAARDGRGLYSEVRLAANEHPFRHSRFRSVRCALLIVG
jgi:hypothetical protein